MVVLAGSNVGSNLSTLDATARRWNSSQMAYFCWESFLETAASAVRKEEVIEGRSSTNRIRLTLDGNQQVCPENDTVKEGPLRLFFFSFLYRRSFICFFSGSAW